MTRPVVKVLPGPPQSRVVGPSHREVIDTPWTAVCQTGDCRWTYTNVVKTDVEQQARWHRDHHRRAT